MKKTALAASSFLLVTVFLWFIAVPESLIVDLIETALSKEYLYLKAEGVKKGLFYNFVAERILLKKRGGSGDSDETLLVFNDVKGRFDFLSLFRLHPELIFRGSMNNGNITGVVSLTGKDSLTITGRDIRIKGIPLFEPLGIYGEGLLSGSFVVRNSTGELKFSVKDVELKSTTVGGVLLPLELFHDIKGAVKMNRDNNTEVQSFAMEGKGIYARVRGTLQGDDMNMSLELMTDSSFVLGPFFEMALGKYRVSPGYYAVPLRGGIPRGEGE